METLPGTIHGEGDPFASTRWTVVLAAAGDRDNPEAAAAALATLCQTYWAPLYTYVRRRNYSPHDAQDLTQGFFNHLIARRIYERTDIAKGKFRSFLLAALKNYLSDARSREQRLKRGGSASVVSLEEGWAVQAESLFQSSGQDQHPQSEIDRDYELSWAQALVNATLARVSAGYQDEGKSALLEALLPFIAGGAREVPTYDELGATLQMPASTLRSHVTRLRARYREALLLEVRQTVRSENDAQEELRELLRVLTAR